MGAALSRGFLRRKAPSSLTLSLVHLPAGGVEADQAILAAWLALPAAVLVNNDQDGLLVAGYASRVVGGTAQQASVRLTTSLASSCFLSSADNAVATHAYAKVRSAADKQLLRCTPTLAAARLEDARAQKHVRRTSVMHVFLHVISCGYSLLTLDAGRAACGQHRGGNGRGPGRAGPHAKGRPGLSIANERTAPQGTSIWRLQHAYRIFFPCVAFVRTGRRTCTNGIDRHKRTHFTQMDACALMTCLDEVNKIVPGFGLGVKLSLVRRYKFCNTA